MDTTFWVIAIIGVAGLFLIYASLQAATPDKGAGVMYVLGCFMLGGALLGLVLTPIIGVFFK